MHTHQNGGTLLRNWHDCKRWEKKGIQCPWEEFEKENEEEESKRRRRTRPEEVQEPVRIPKKNPVRIPRPFAVGIPGRNQGDSDERGDPDGTAQEIIERYKALREFDTWVLEDEVPHINPPGRITEPVTVEGIAYTYPDINVNGEITRVTPGGEDIWNPGTGWPPFIPPSRKQPPIQPPLPTLATTRELQLWPLAKPQFAFSFDDLSLSEELLTQALPPHMLQLLTNEFGGVTSSGFWTDARIRAALGGAVTFGAVAIGGGFISNWSALVRALTNQSGGSFAGSF